MRNIAEIFKREIRLYFTTPIAYVVMVMFSGVFGFIFFRNMTYYSQLSYQIMQNQYLAQHIDLIIGIFSPVFGSISIIFLMMLPPISMRLFAEEKKSGTIELLFTYPLKDTQIVMGKWIAAVTILIMMMALTLPGPFLAFGFAKKSEWGPVLSGYLGLFLMSLSFLSIGILISALSQNQIVAVILSYGVLLGFWFLSWAVDPYSGKMMAKVFSEMSIISHLNNFVKGIIDTKDVVYYVLLSFIAVFLTMRALESKRWRG